MSEFTPGPWTAVNNGHYWQINSKQIGQVGDACASNTDCNGDKKTPHIAKANASLMAAAPEMYDKLKELFETHHALDYKLEYILKKARGE